MASNFIKKTFDNCLSASDIPNELYERYNVKKGLRNANGTGVLVLLTKISDVYGYKIENNQKVDDEGHLYYRGYDIFDLVKCNKEKYGFERICYLILFSKLPTDQEVRNFHDALASQYLLPKGFVEDVLFKNVNPSVMNQIQKAIINLYGFDDNPDDASPLSTLDKGLNIIAKLPSIISYSYRAKKHYIDGLSLHIRNPRREYSIAENLLRMSRTHGDFNQLEVETLDLALILHADHGGGNNSTFANLVVSSTATDIYSAMCASLGSLKGPRHGGANKSVKDMMSKVIKRIGLDATEEQIVELGNKIRELKIDGVPVVNQAVRKTKEDALTSMKERFKEKQDLLATFEGENNIFSESYVVTLTDLKYSSRVQDEITKMENVKRITSRDQTVTTLLNLANGIKIITGAILVLLICISMFIIANTIKLTVHARRKEISIMKYVGATNNFIRWPFIVEGMIIGIIASAISIMIIGLLYNMVADGLVNSDFMKRINMSLLQFGDLFNYIFLTYMGLGLGIGALGSIISMRKYLKV